MNYASTNTVRWNWKSWACCLFGATLQPWCRMRRIGAALRQSDTARHSNLVIPQVHSWWCCAVPLPSTILYNFLWCLFKAGKATPGRQLKAPTGLDTMAEWQGNVAGQLVGWGWSPLSVSDLGSAEASSRGWDLTVIPAFHVDSFTADKESWSSNILSLSKHNGHCTLWYCSHRITCSCSNHQLKYSI
jgi:hypothetical protein